MSWSDLIFLTIGLYLACGFIFALYLLAFGQKLFGESVTHSKWGFKVMVFPSLVGLWPLLLRPLFGMAEVPFATGTIRSLQGITWLFLLILVPLVGFTLLFLRSGPVAEADEVQQIQSLINPH